MKKLSFIILTILTLLTLLPIAGCNSQTSWKYPQAKTENIVDDYHGTKVADPYRWLENQDSKETLNWVNKENKITRKYIDSISQKRKIKEVITKRWNYPRYTVPYKKGNRYFYWHNNGLQNQAVFYMKKSLDGQALVVINPNLLSKDGTTAINSIALSEDGTLMAYALTQSGSDLQKIKIRNIDTAKDYDETINFGRFTSIAWKHDNSGFFYNRYPDPNTIAKEDSFNYNKVYYHEIGTKQLQDELIYEDPTNKLLSFAPHISEDGQYLILHVYQGTEPKNRIYYKNLHSQTSFFKLLDKADARYDFITNLKSKFYFLTDLDAPRFKLIAIDTQNPDVIEEVIPQQQDVIDEISFVNRNFVVTVMHDVHHLLKTYDTNGNYLKDIPLPAKGTAGGISGHIDDPEMFFAFTSYLFPYTSYRYDFNTDKTEVYQKPEIDFDSDNYKTTQVFYSSKDGTKIPMYIISKKNIKLDSSNPTLLYGYGGFNVSLRPGFSIKTISWLDLGGVYAVANLRGGNEYGEVWHQQGILDKKQNVFYDFIAAAEYLIDNKYTSPKKLAIQGGSNGGLLTAACAIQRPELFGAVACHVPVTDMLRYHKFTVGRYWVSDYGNAEEDPQAFKYLYKYSPLHNVPENYDNPSILVTSADTDDRVVPAHAKKLVATMQKKSIGQKPILLRVETKAGHGQGKPTSKQIDELTDVFTFLYKSLNMEN